MLQKLQGIVLCTLKYSDKSNIVRIYTQQEGQQSFLIPATRSRKSTVSSVLFQPLSLVEFESDIRPKSGLHPIREARIWQPLLSLPYHPFKSGIALFLAEFLHRTLNGEVDNRPLFDYLVHSVLWLDACEDHFANFQLVFLMRLTRFLGMYPNTEDFQEGDCFDLLNACFSSVPPTHGLFLSPDEASKVCSLLRMKYETMHLFAMNRDERNRCLDIICRYYRLHLPDFPELKSINVLKELFT